MAFETRHNTTHAWHITTTTTYTFSWNRTWQDVKEYCM